MSLAGRARRVPAQNATAADGPLLMEAAALGSLHATLQRAGFRVIGPAVRDGAIGRRDDRLPFRDLRS